MGGWMDRMTDGYMDRWADEWKEGYILSKLIERRMDG